MAHGGPCSNRHVPFWQMPNDVIYCQQLPTVQAGGQEGAAVQIKQCPMSTALNCLRLQSATQVDRLTIV